MSFFPAQTLACASNPSQIQLHLMTIHAAAHVRQCPLQLCKSNNEDMHVILGSGNLSDPNYPCPAPGQQYPVRACGSPGSRAHECLLG